MVLNIGSLNPQQREAVVTTEGPVLILAGAGTGKTRVITYRIAHMISKGISPGKVLAVTFTNKAAKEMQERIRQLLPKQKKSDKNAKADHPTICTFHSLGARILRQYIERIGYKKNFVIYSDSEQLGAVKKVLSHFSAKGEKIDPVEIMGCISKLKSGMSATRFSSDVVVEFSRMLMARYESALHACNAVDFDDLLGLPIRLFKEHEDILKACRERFQYVMVDEYQDTNAAQFEMVRLLTSEHQNLCVVGDDDQSIYGWRGAEIANLLDMEKHYPKVKVVKLEQNYRSTNTILETANAVIVKNPMRRGKKLWSQKGQGTPIQLYTFNSDEDEAREVVQLIEFARLAKSIPWGKQAILFRTNIQARPLETALRAARVRYNLVGGQSYFDRREVKDFLAYMKVMINPHDDISLLRIANVPARGLSDVTMERLLAASQERKCSVFSAMRHTDVQGAFISKIRDAIFDFIHLIEGERNRLEQETSRSFSLRNWAEHLMDRIQYWNELRRGEKEPEAAENRIRNLRDLAATLDSPSREGNTPMERLESFLEDITLDNEREDEKEIQDNMLTLITTHSCKGLEFPHVYIVGLEEGLLPHSRSIDENTLEEERRLFYVAITRAQETLTISHCMSRKKYGENVACHPSRFLLDLPKHLVERADEKSKQPVSVAAGKAHFANLKSMLENLKD